jgi:methionine-rich copper-binding protein CopC
MVDAKHVMRSGLWVAVVVALLLAGRFLEAHAILKETSPAANSTVAGPDVPMKLRFNVRVDAGRSKLQLLNPDNSVTELKLDKQPAPDTLAARGSGLKAGSYTIRWQVLAPDGHITRGEIPFKVTGS